ncbi:MAG: M14 family metallopeptidase, partial [Bacteroidota bacterium]
RPQLLAVVSSPANLARIEDIRKDNLIRAGLMEGTPSSSEPIAIVWLGHSVHGNEAAGSESVLQTIYKLANPAETEVQSWLENTVVLVEPSLNPDGYSRYTTWYRQTKNKDINAAPEAIEHMEPWPGGRTNHYYFDLNRDWAWQTQQESQNRIKIYRQWYPHVHADIHEQGVNSPYYFAPAARPYHEHITDFQVDFQQTIGENHMKYFDENGWLYFTREVFDLLYPSYADTYSTFNGAVGMTYEQGGSGRAGRSIEMENEDELTLKDRVMHHHTAALSTVEISAKNAEKLVAESEQFFTAHRKNPKGNYTSYIIKGSNSKDKMAALCELLDKNGIQYGKAGTTKNLRGFHYQSAAEQNCKLEEDDLVVSAHQPLSVLVQVLFEPRTALEDSLTYDITAWSLPYAYGLDTYAVKDKLGGKGGYAFAKSNSLQKTDLNRVRNAYAFIIPWGSLKNVSFLGALMQTGVKVRTATRSFTIEGQSHPVGTIVVTRADNRKMGDQFYETMVALSESHAQEMQVVQTGAASKGSDLGSGNVELLVMPKILLLTDEGTYSGATGATWHYFERVLNYPVTRVRVSDFSRVPLNDYNVVVLPQGSYRSMNKSAYDRLSSWVREGGKLIAVGSAVERLVNQGLLSLERSAGEGEDKSAESEPIRYNEQERDYISNSIPGAIVKVKVDNSHPLGYGLNDYYYAIKTGTTAYKKTESGWNTGYLDDRPYTVGFVGSKVGPRLKNSTMFGVERKRRGEVVYLIDDPLFR